MSSDKAGPANDPMGMLRDAYAQGIERWSKAMEEIVGSEDFAAASGQLLALYAQQQQSLRAASRVAAENLQVPTTEDLAEVSRLVINVERKVDEIADHTTALSARLAEATAASQDVSERLARLEQAIGELARGPAGQPAPAGGAQRAASGTADAPDPATGDTAKPARPARAAKKTATSKGTSTRRRTPPADG